MGASMQIDFQLYIALLATELPRFSIPGLGTFIWHIERCHVDPKSGTVAPPRPTLKYEPGNRYLEETIGFLRDHYGFSAEDAEAFLKEVGKLASSYLRAAPEMELWKLGKLKRIGGVYKVELNEEAQAPLTVDMVEISLRAGVGNPVASLPAKKEAAPPPSKKAPKEKPRARVAESLPHKTSESTLTPAVSTSSKRHWLTFVIGIGVIILLIGLVSFWLLQRKHPPKPVEITLSPTKAPKTTPSSKEEKPTPQESPQTKPESRPLAPEKPAKQKAEAIQPPKEVLQPPSAEPKPKAKGPRYYIIVGSYPSKSEAEAKAAEFSGYSIEYLPGKQPGWVRLSVFSSTNPAEVEERLREIKSRVPDAWVYVSP
ncbi:MAG: SPOR domain-containing protein [Bacteroidia bacterium]|nr:SPOR domain-containing protein [Bacteroidia bacterium]MDW8133429.1 SPOR domain-containing protein [Bacteroidia bacterium]